MERPIDNWWILYMIRTYCGYEHERAVEESDDFVNWFEDENLSLAPKSYFLPITC